MLAEGISFSIFLLTMSKIFQLLQIQLGLFRSEAKQHFEIELSSLIAKKKPF
jgi:hypothetical protein